MTALFFATATNAAPPAEEGKTIFAARCAACHNVNKVLTGPALAGVEKRHSLEWIVNFVKSSQTVIKNGDPEAVALFNKFNRIPMPDHADLNEGQIKNIVEYIKVEATTGQPEKKAAAEKPNAWERLSAPLATAGAGFYVTLSALFGLLVVVSLFAFQVKRYERRVKAGQ